MADATIHNRRISAFAAWPTDAILSVLDAIYDLHVQLVQRGWIAVDFYDGCLMYDFERQAAHIVDLDMYHLGAFTNQMGRMFGLDALYGPRGIRARRAHRRAHDRLYHGPHRSRMSRRRHRRCDGGGRAARLSPGARRALPLYGGILRCLAADEIGSTRCIF